MFARRRTVAAALAGPLIMITLLAPASAAAVTVMRASVSSVGVAGDSNSFSPVSVSANGRYVVFRSIADNLVAESGGPPRIYLRNPYAHTLTHIVGPGGYSTGDLAISANSRLAVFDSNARISLSASGTQANGASGDAGMSADGGVIAFESDATNLVAGDTNAGTDIFVRR